MKYLVYNSYLRQNIVKFLFSCADSTALFSVIKQKKPRHTAVILYTSISMLPC